MLVYYYRYSSRNGCVVAFLCCISLHFAYCMFTVIVVLQYEAVIDSPSSLQYLQHIILYECQGNAPELEQMAREQGRVCHKPSPFLECNAIVAAWARGSEVSNSG